jgi:hypothetical protein
LTLFDSPSMVTNPSARADGTPIDYRRMGAASAVDSFFSPLDPHALAQMDRVWARLTSTVRQLHGSKGRSSGVATICEWGGLLLRRGSAKLSLGRAAGEAATVGDGDAAAVARCHGST